MDRSLQKRKAEKVLIADDEPSVRDIIMRLLTTRGYACDGAGDGQEALAKIKENGFALVISDVKMPNTDGLALLRQVMNDEEDIAFIMITGYADLNTAVESLKIGAYDYVTKPLDIDVLSWDVEMALENRRLRIEDKRARVHLKEIVYQKNLKLERKSQKLRDSLNQLKVAQTHLLQSEKMASLGQLVAGVVHEITNPIGFVNSNLETSKNYLARIQAVQEKYDEMEAYLEEAQDERLRFLLAQIREITMRNKIDSIIGDFVDLLDESLEGVQRVKKIVNDLKGFSHPGKNEMSDADINECLESTLNIMWNEFKYKATFVKLYGELPRVRCYAEQLNQVFMNILVNAARAIEGEGEIRIQTRCVYRDGSSDNQKRRYVEVKISDTGSGIPKENLSKVFDPFFTTKEVGEGTGLGLSTSYSIVKKHNGRINVESQVGKGTTFTVLIPACES
jgi:signal transduction histidine kinase